MSAYNKVNGDYAGGNGVLLTGRAQGRVGLPGLGHVRLGRDAELGVRAAGLDQECGRADRRAMWGAEAFTGPLRQALAEGRFPRERLSDMVRRILRSMFAVGIDRWDPAPEVDLAAHHEIALETARQGIVLLRTTACCRCPPTSASRSP